MTSTDWFRTVPTADDRRTAFLSALAEAARLWTSADVSPEDTSTDLDQADGGLVVVIEVPGLTSSRRHLSVRYRPDVRGRPALQSAWSHGPYDFDDEYDNVGAPDEDDLWVSGIDATPEQCGGWAAAWFERQLRRRVTRREWDRPTSGLGTLIPADDSGPVAVEWLMGSPDGVFDSRGGFTWWWLMRRPPSRVIVERPGDQG